MTLWSGNDKLMMSRLVEGRLFYLQGVCDTIYTFSPLLEMLRLNVAPEQTFNPYFSCISNEFPGSFNVTEIKNIIGGLGVSVEEEAIPYLISHENIFSLVLDAKIKLDSYFDSKLTKYYLSRIYDPETQSEGLMLEIRTDQCFTEAMACLEKFEDDWWLDNMPTNGDKFVIDVVFA